MHRYVGLTGSMVFDRQAFIEVELARIVAETGSTGTTPEQTLSRELQQLRDVGVLEFLGAGSYRLRDATHLRAAEAGASKGVLIITSQVDAEEVRYHYRFDKQWLTAMSKLVRQWVVYQQARHLGSRGYYATAKITSIRPDPTQSGGYLALLEQGSFLEFGRDVPFELDGSVVERGLLYPNGRINNGRANQTVRTISDDDFNRIVEHGLVAAEELPPRLDDQPSSSMLREEQVAWDGPVDRTRVLVERTVRDRQFRKRVLDAYDSRCALTGIKLINGGGRAETQAAHIKAVEAGGPDVVTNGIALSGTVHWMFDRGLLSVSDHGDILLSHKINDIESVERLIFADRKARFPVLASERPSPIYLEWHRTHCFHG